MSDRSPQGQIEVVTASQVPAPAGHYSQAVCWKDLVLVSGQLPSAPVDETRGDLPFEAQVRQALSKVFAIVEQAGGTRESILRVTAYIVDVERWPEFNRIYADAFGSHRPARTVVPVTELHHGFLVEVDAIAFRL